MYEMKVSATFISLMVNLMMQIKILLNELEFKYQIVWEWIFLK